MNSVWAVVRSYNGHTKVMVLYAKEEHALQHCADANAHLDYKGERYEARVYQVEREYRRNGGV